MLTHKGTMIIETERLILRRFKLEDADEMFNNWANDIEVTKFLTWKPHINVESTTELLKGWVASYEKSSTYNFAIELKAKNTLIGSIGAMEIDENARRCEIGYCMSKAFWGQGLMTEALRALINYLFIEVNFNRIQARHDTKNPASGRVMQKAGMKYEGTMRQYYLKSNEILADCYIYAVLREDN